MGERETTIELRIVNADIKFYEVSLDPWRAWLVLEAGAAVHVVFAVPDSAWAEMTFTESAVFVHGWDDAPCRVDLCGEARWAELPDLDPGARDEAAGRPGSTVVAASSPKATSDSGRPSWLQAWASELPHGAQRLLLYDARSGRQGLSSPAPILLSGWSPYQLTIDSVVLRISTLTSANLVGRPLP